MRYLIVDWLRFVPAVALLLTPIAVFHGKKVRYRAIARDWDRHWPQTLALGLHTIDFLRAALGSWLLLDSLQQAPNLRGAAGQTLFVTVAGIRILAVVIQTVVCKERESIHAPFMFVAGMLVTGPLPIPATIALALSTPLVLGMRTPTAFFPILSALLLTTAYLFGGRGGLVKLIPDAFAALVPWLWWLLFSRELVVSYRMRRAEGSRGHSALR